MPTGPHISLHRTYFATCADATVVPNLGHCELLAMSPDRSGSAGLPNAPASCRALPVIHPTICLTLPDGDVLRYIALVAKKDAISPQASHFWMFFRGPIRIDDVPSLVPVCPCPPRAGASVVVQKHERVCVGWCLLCPPPPPPAKIHPNQVKNTQRGSETCFA